MKRRHATLALLTAPLTGCALTRTVVSDLGITPADAVAAYQIAKGIAGVAVLADPALAPIVAAIVAIADPLMARVQAGFVTPDALVAQATVLTVRTAGVVRVVAA